MRRRIYYLLLLAVAFIGLAGCDKEDGDKIPDAVIVSRTLFIYMGGDDSSLSGYDAKNIDSIKRAATKENIGNGKVLIFHDRRGDVPRLLQITAGVNGAVEKELETYPDNPGTEQKEILAQAIEKMQKVAKAKSYGMVLWSHGSGWLPGGVSSPYSNASSSNNNWGELGDEQSERGIKPQSVYVDKGRHMELADFASALPDGLFDFIIMDECYSAGIEALWALRKKADHLVVSAAEEDIRGMPYYRMIPHVFAKTPRLGQGGVGEAYYTYYTTYDQLDPYKQLSATTSTINCAQLDDNFADLMRRIIAQGVTKIGGLEANNISVIQYYDRNYGGHMFHDLLGFVNAILPVGDPLLAEFDAKIGQIVEYKKATETLFSPNFKINLEKYSGITTYMPVDAYVNLNVKYKDTEWYKAVYPVGFIP